MLAEFHSSLINEGISMSNLYRFLSLLTCLVTIPSVANEQIVEHLDWQTFETENFRIHFTPEYKEWGISAANELERIRTLIQQQQGRVLADKADVIVFDPLNQSNGSAAPFSNKPLMRLYTTPALSDSRISSNSSWQQLLLLHEYVHLVHLAQPYRNPLRNWTSRLWDLWDISHFDPKNAPPQWVTEGYATLLESKLTGSGRLYHNQIEARLMQFAREGALRTYNQLHGVMAYLVGSRFLEWLEERYSEKTLDSVWPRLIAKKGRSFDEAFKGVFRKSPRQLYQRFAAEYTAKAINTERLPEQGDPELWLDLPDSARAPAISPNKKQLALVQFGRNGGERFVLNIYDMKADPKAPEEFEKAQQRLLENDPQDIADAPPLVFNRKSVKSLNEKDYLGISNPRWLNDTTIIFGTLTRDSRGLLHQDLNRWDLSSGQVTQLTRSDNIRRFDIDTEHQVIYAERTLLGKSQLIAFDLNSRDITEITPASLTTVYDFPRLNPQSMQQLAYVSSALNQDWQLRVRDLSDNSEIVIPAPVNYQFLSYPEWSPNGQQLYFMAGLEGEVNLYRYDLQSQQLAKISQVNAPLSWPVAVSDDELLALSITSEGNEVVSIDLNTTAIAQVQDITTSAGSFALVEYPHKVSEAEINLNQSIGKLKPYAPIKQQEVSFNLGFNINTTAFSQLDIGIKGGDVLQRFDWHLNYARSIENSALSGFSGSVRWQGWPLKISAHLYDIDLDASRQRDPTLNFSQDLSGGFIRVNYPLQHNRLKLNLIGQINTNDGETTDEDLFSLGAQQSWAYDSKPWGIYQRANFRWLDGESTLNNDIASLESDWQGFDADVVVGIRYNDIILEGQANRQRRFDTILPLLTLGGFNSTVFNADAHLNRIFSPELAFDARSTNDYRYYQVGLKPNNTPVRFIYGRHELASQPSIDVYGLKGGFNLEGSGLTLTDLYLDYGILRVNPEEQESETEAWLGLRYQF